MARGGRFVGPLGSLSAAAAGLRPAAEQIAGWATHTVLSARARMQAKQAGRKLPNKRQTRLAARWESRLSRKGLGTGLAVAFLGASLVYGIHLGRHWGEVGHLVASLPDRAANMLGFQISAVTMVGQNGLTDEEVLGALGITDQHSLPFLDVRAARERLLQNPLIADATIRKLYPDRLLVALKERRAFALWQQEGEVSIIAEDGTVIDRLRDRRYADLPLVVGPGAAREAKAFMAMLESHPVVRERLYAGIYVAERRWTLRLRDGVNVLLPESGVEPALQQTDKLIARGDLLDRDITAIDLRVAGQVVVRLSDEAAEKMAAADKEKAKKAKRGDT